MSTNRRMGSLAAEWRRIRALEMFLTTILLVWGGSRLLAIAIDATRSTSGAQAQVLVDDFGALSPAAPESVETVGPKLRDDLFAVPGAPKRVEREQPRTNPAELLQLIELQGVIGGKRPRAMVHFRQSQETVTVSAGDDLGEFVVVEIRERSVVLRWRDELFVLSL